MDFDVESYYDSLSEDETLIICDRLEIDINLLIPDYGYQFDNASALVNKADMPSMMGTPNYLNQRFYNPFDKSVVYRVTEFKAGVLKHFINQYGPIVSEFDVGDYSETISITSWGSDEGLHLLTMVVEPCAQRIQVAISLIPDGDTKETVIEYYWKEFNSLPNLQQPTPDYTGGKLMPIGIPVVFDHDWPLDVKKQYWYAEQCNTRSMSEENVLNACEDQGLDRSIYKRMFDDLRLRQKQYLYNRDSIISELQKIKKGNFTS